MNNGALSINGSYYFFVGGNWRRSYNAGITGASTIVFNGTGTWSDLYPSQQFAPPLIINTTGTITFSGSISKSVSLVYIAGTVDTTSSTLSLTAACILNVNGDSNPTATTVSSTGINFNNLMTTASGTHTVTGNIRICGTHSAGGGGFNSGAYIYNSGDYNISSNTGAALYNYIMDGTGTISTTIS